MKKTNSLPQHIAIIMDGNRRWARQHKMEILKGHAYVADHVIEELVDTCIEQGVPYLTLWAFSTENWNRDQSEVIGLLGLLRRAFNKKSSELHNKGVRLNVIGDIDKFPTDIAEGIKKWLKTSEKNTKITVTFALNYGGRDEIIRAIHQAAEDKINLQKVTIEQFSQYLDTARHVQLPDPDLIIRPGGEFRLSGYLPWQSTYAELYFSDILMPDFGRKEMLTALEEYGRRQRRFGA